MKNLKQLTDAELIAYYEQMNEAENIEHSMDGSGELGPLIAAEFQLIWEAFDKEFEARNIDLYTDCDFNYDDLPF